MHTYTRPTSYVQKLYVTWLYVTKDKIELFEVKRKFLADNGIANLNPEDLAPHLYELADLLKEFITLYQPKHLKGFIEKRQKDVKDSILDGQERRAKVTVSQAERDISKPRKKLSPRLKLIKTLHETCNIPVRDLYKLGDKELKLKLAEFLMWQGSYNWLLSNTGSIFINPLCV